MLLRGLAAGLIAGLLAGLVGLAVGGPAMESAISLEAAAEQGHADAAGDEPTFSRPVQRAGLVAGSTLLGGVLGLLFGVAAGWAIGRLAGDSWTRSLKLGAVAIGALALLPSLAVPASPPGIGDPATLRVRTAAYLLVGVIGVLLAAAGRLTARAMAERGIARPLRQTVLGTAGLAAVGLVLLVQPAPAVATGAFPAELLWRFRLGALATQITLHGGLAVTFGLLASRRERAETPVPARTA